MTKNRKGNTKKGRVKIMEEKAEKKEAKEKKGSYQMELNKLVWNTIVDLFSEEIEKITARACSIAFQQWLTGQGDLSCSAILESIAERSKEHFDSLAKAQSVFEENDGKVPKREDAAVMREAGLPVAKARPNRGADFVPPWLAPKAQKKIEPKTEAKAGK
jgi:hypothetical protein